MSKECYYSETMKAVVALLAVVFLAGAVAFEDVECPIEDSPILYCLLQPCRFSHCPNYPIAVCKNDYCRACKARYFVGEEDVTEDCTSQA